ncbi:FGGY family carbohydrate kinase [Streptomyces sp. NPDC057474]|uniref:FGGY family carbohydrate kinase n=1 Tax=Streptomyces sp. NPDC057474 TaxID=3346144 RepID=UPI0036C66F72
MARELVLGVDAGHTVTKAVLFDATGRAVARGSGTLPLSTPHPRWVERDMDDVWRTAHQAIADCLAQAGPGVGRSVAAVGLAGHGDGLYAIDGRGRPVRAAIVAMDMRAEPVLEEWRGTPVWSQALELSGTVPFAGSPAALLAWLARHEHRVLQEARWHHRAMWGWSQQVDFLRGAEETAYRELTAPDAWIPYPDTEPVLRALHERGLRIAIVSDFA